MGKNASHPDLANPSKWDLSRMSYYTAKSASRQYIRPRNLGLILNLLLRAPEHELPTETKSHYQPRLNPGNALDESQDSPLPPPRDIREPRFGRGSYAGSSKPRTKGKFLQKHVRTSERYIMQILSQKNPQRNVRHGVDFDVCVLFLSWITFY